MKSSEDQSPEDAAKSPGWFQARWLALVSALAVFLFALAHEPAGEWSDQVGGLDESLVFGLVMAVLILLINEAWVRWIRARLSGVARFAAVVGFSAPIGYAVGDQSAGFRLAILNDAERWLLDLNALDVAGLGLGGLLVILGAALFAALTPSARIEADLTRRDQRLIAASLPVMLGEGALLILIVAARQLDWTAPGAAHGAVLFLAGAAFLASIWFSAAIYAKMDEQERSLVYRQSTATFVVFFFVLAAWALAEALTIAPALNAFGAFLLLNGVYLAIGVPWTLWHQRHEMFGPDAGER